MNNSTNFLGMSDGMATAILLLLALLLAAVIYILIQTQRTAKRNAAEPAAEPETDNSWLAKLEHFGRRVQRRSNPLAVAMVSGMVFILIVIFSLYDRTQDVGTQIGYAPEQPVKFNHKLHAGQYQIKCQYCHTGVDRGKQATIPATSTCMNCHNAIKEGPQFGKTEIAKVEASWKNQEPIRWVRVHNLPDHVYFNHQQHVVAGGLDCENCHGKVAEMERIQAVSTLEMGWCINCHRETKVNSSNPYYTSSFDFVKAHKSYTVAQLGGIECSRCHY